MVNKPKAKGTAAETACVKYAQANGFPEARRNPLTGSKDTGDLTLCDRVIVEVKADKSLDYPRFIRETEAERVNAQAAVGLCFIKPPGVAEGRMRLWWCLMHAGTYEALEQLAGSRNFMAYFHEVHDAIPAQRKGPGKTRTKFDPGRILAGGVGLPGTMLKPGAKRISRAVGDIRFLYLPDALELLRWAGFGEPMRPVPPEGRGFLTPGIQGFQADRVWFDEQVKRSN
jgi:hypothetical protein